MRVSPPVLPLVHFLHYSTTHAGLPQVAGHETTGSVLTWTVDLLARNPEKLRKVRFLSCLELVWGLWRLY